MVGNHRQPNNRGFVSRNGAVAPSGISSKDLAIGVLGLFPQSALGGDPKSTTTPNVQLEDVYQLAYGVPKSAAAKQSDTFIKGAWKSPVFNAKTIKNYKVHRALKLNGGSQGEVWTLGYDGIDASKTLSSRQDWHDVSVELEVRGTPISKAWSSRKQNFTFFLDKTCIPAEVCPKDCTDEEAGCIEGEWLADRFIKNFNKTKYMGKHLSDFVKVTKLVKKCPAGTPKTVSCKSYILTVPCDSGDDSSLGLVQAQYQGFTVTQLSHNSATKETQYEMWRTVADAAPLDFELKDTVVPNCTGICSTGFTKVDKVKVFYVAVPCGTPVVATTSSVLLSPTLTQDTYEVLEPVTSTLETVQAANPTCSIVKYQGERTALCVQTTAMKYSWTPCKEAFKITKDWRITLADKVCEGCENQYTDRLEDLQKAYPHLVIEIEAAGNCVHTYKTTTMSDCTVEGCGEEAVFTIQPPSAFGREMGWVEISAPIALCPDCTEPVEQPCVCEAVGLRFETVSFNRHTGECAYGSYNWSQDDNEPVMMNLSVRSKDYTSTFCDRDFKNVVKKLQEIKYERGQGASVRALEYGWFNYYYDLQGFEQDPFVREILGTVAVAKPELYYDEIQFDVTEISGGEFVVENHTFAHDVKIRIFVEEGKGTQIVNLLNKLVASLNNPNVLPIAY